MQYVTYSPIIIGATPAGNFLANELAKEGQKPIVLEEKNSPAKYSRFAGIISKEFLNIAKLKESDIREVKYNEINNLVVHFPSGSALDLSLKNSYMVVDYPTLNKTLYAMAESNGANFFFENKIEKLVVADKVVGRTNKLRFVSELLISTDVRDSVIAQKYNAQTRKVHGIEAHCRYSSTGQNIHLFLGKKYSGAPYAWIIPEDENYARIGMLCNSVDKESQTKLNKLVHYIDAEPIEYYSSTAPSDFRDMHSFERVLLLGDAGAHVKANSLGDITPSFIAANYAKDAIVKAYDEQNFSKDFLNSNYSDKLNQHLGKNFKLSMKARRIAKALTDREWNQIHTLLSKSNIKSIVENNGDLSFFDSVIDGIKTDYSSRFFMMKFAFRHPSLIKNLI